jgi:hypothetical protein
MAADDQLNAWTRGYNHRTCCQGANNAPRTLNGSLPPRASAIIGEVRIGIENIPRKSGGHAGAAPSTAGEMNDESIEVKLAQIRYDIEEIFAVLYGSRTGGKGLFAQVEALAKAADRGTWSLRTMLWLGSAGVALLTALSQFRSAWTTIWGND